MTRKGSTVKKRLFEKRIEARKSDQKREEAFVKIKQNYRFEFCQVRDEQRNKWLWAISRTNLDNNVEYVYKINSVVQNTQFFLKSEDFCIAASIESKD